MPSDDMEWVNIRKVRKVYRYLKSLVGSLDAIDTDETTDTDFDSITFEIAAIKRSLGWLYPVVLKILGIPRLETRQDMDRMASTLSELFMGISVE